LPPAGFSPFRMRIASTGRDSGLSGFHLPVGQTKRRA